MLIACITSNCMIYICNIIKLKQNHNNGLSTLPYCTEHLLLHDCSTAVQRVKCTSCKWLQHDLVQTNREWRHSFTVQSNSIFSNDHYHRAKSILNTTDLQYEQSALRLRNFTRMKSVDIQQSDNRCTQCSMAVVLIMFRLY